MKKSIKNHILNIAFFLFTSSLLVAGEPILDAAEKKNDEEIINLVKSSYWFEIDDFLEEIQNIYKKNGSDFNGLNQRIRAAEKESINVFYEKFLAVSKQLRAYAEKSNEDHLKFIQHSFSIGSIDKNFIYFLRENHVNEASLLDSLQIICSLLKLHETSALAVLIEGCSGEYNRNIVTVYMLRYVALSLNFNLMFDRNFPRYDPIKSANVANKIIDALEKEKKQDFPDPNKSFLSNDFLWEKMNISRVIGWDKPDLNVEAELIRMKTDMFGSMTERNQPLANLLVSLYDQMPIVVIAGGKHIPQDYLSLGGTYFGRTDNLLGMYSLAEQENDLTCLSSKCIFEAIKNFNFATANMNVCYY